MATKKKSALEDFQDFVGNTAKNIGTTANQVRNKARNSLLDLGFKPLSQEEQKKPFTQQYMGAVKSIGNTAKEVAPLFDYKNTNPTVRGIKYNNIPVLGGIRQGQMKVLDAASKVPVAGFFLDDIAQQPYRYWDKTASFFQDPSLKTGIGMTAAGADIATNILLPGVSRAKAVKFLPNIIKGGQRINEAGQLVKVGSLANQAIKLGGIPNAIVAGGRSYSDGQELPQVGVDTLVGLVTGTGIGLGFPAATAALSKIKIPQSIKTAVGNFVKERTQASQQKLMETYALEIGKPKNKALVDVVNSYSSEKPLEVNPFRNGQLPNVNTTDMVARERFNIPALKKINFGGSDRDVYDLGNGQVLKVAKNGRGIRQNEYGNDYYLQGENITPRITEAGKNYIVADKVLPPDVNTKAFVQGLKKFSFDDWQRQSPELQEYLTRYNMQGVLNYDLLTGDFSSIRNWGTTADGKPIHLDEGTFMGTHSIGEFRGTKPLQNPEYRDAYLQSRAAKQQFGDTDVKTAYLETQNPVVKNKVLPPASQFFSNNEDDLNFAQGADKINSPAQQALIKIGEDVNNKYGIETLRAESLIGDTASYGTENSLRHDFVADNDLSRVVAAEKGLQGNQLSVLNFVDNPNGKDTLIEFNLPKDLTLLEVRDILTEHNLEFRSINPQTNGITIADVGSESINSINKLLEKYDITATSRRGTADFIGDTSDNATRERAAEIYTKIIEDYRNNQTRTGNTNNELSSQALDSTEQSFLEIDNPTKQTDNVVNLPRELRGAKPRYGENQLQFQSDIDKALYIVGNPNKTSASDGAYMGWLEEQFPDLSEPEIRALGLKVRDSIKGLSGENGVITVPPVNSKNVNNPIQEKLSKELDDALGDAGTLTQKGNETIFSNKTDIAEYDSLLDETPLGVDPSKTVKQYYAESKGRAGEVVMMSPDEYLKEIGGGEPTKSSIDFMKARLANGEKLNMPSLEYKNGVLTGQEGRNRAYIAKELGIEQMPVLKSTDAPTQNSTQGKIKAELDDFLTEKTPQPKGVKKPLAQFETKVLQERYKKGGRNADLYGQELQRRGLDPENPTNPKERGFVESVRQNENQRTEVRENVKGVHEPTTDEIRLQAGRDFIAKNPQEAERFALSDEPVTEEGLGIYYALNEKYNSEADALEQAGNFAEANAIDLKNEQIINKLAEKLTPVARTLQMAHLFSQKSPQGMIRWAERLYKEANEVKNLNAKRLVKKIVGKDTEIKLTDEKKKFIVSEMRRIQKISDPLEKQQAIRQLTLTIGKDIPASVLQLTSAYRYQNMLIGPRTQLRNLVANLVNGLIIRPTTLQLTAINDLIAKPFGGKGQGNLLDAPRYMVNFMGGLQSSMKEFEKGFQGLPSTNKLDDTVEFSPYADVARENVPKFLTIAGRTLEGVDRFMTELIISGEMAINKKRGMSDTEAKIKAIETAAQYLYRKDLDINNITGQGKLLSKFDKTTKAITNFRNDIPLLNLFVPFIRVPMAVAKMSLEYNPITGPATLIGAQNKSEQIAKMELGSILMLWGAVKAAEGNLTFDAPTDEKQKKAFFDSGRRPFSVKIGDKWIPMQYFGPLALNLAIPAAWHYYTEESRTAPTDSASKKITSGALSVLKYFSQTTPLSGIGGFINVASGDEDFTLPKQIAFTLGQFISLNALNNYVAQVLDPIYRKPDGFIDQFKKGIPGLSDDLEPYTDAEGQPSKIPASGLLLPYTLGTENPAGELPYQLRTKELQSNAIKNQAEKDIKKSLKQDNVGGVSENKTNPNRTDLENYILGADANLDIEGLTPESVVKLERSNDFNYIRKLVDKSSELGVSPETVAQELERKGISADDFLYDNKTILAADIKYDEIKAAVEGLQGEDLLVALGSMRKISEGSRKALLNNTNIDDLVDDGILDKKTAKYLKSVVWNTKTGKFETKKDTSSSKKGTQLKVSAPNIKVPSIKFTGPSARSSGIKLTKNKYKAPKVPKIQPINIKAFLKAPQVKIKTLPKSLSSLGNA